MPVIRNHADLAAYLGANDATETSISRRIYKDTECGAWASLAEEPITRRRTRRWQISITRSILGPVINLRRRPHGGWITNPADLPHEVREFLQLDPRYQNRMVCAASYDELEKTDLSDIGGRRQRSRHSIKLLVPIDETIATGKTRRGVKFGSIVEGIDATTSVHEVWYPASSDEIDAAIQGVEDEARTLWNDTHGCETCRKHWRELGRGDVGGYAPVWDECPDCGGHGTAF